MPTQHRLPIEEVIGRIMEMLAQHESLVVIAPPGAGKTTRVPLACLRAPWLGGRKIVMLEPRRLSARAAARHMAALLNEEVGDTVGYRVRGDTAVSSATRIEVVTEGVLTRMLQADPALTGVGLVIFDEFHERHLHTDLGLALSLHSRSVLGSDFRLVLMSATMDGEQIARQLGAPLVSSEGRTFPVETIWLEAPMPDDPERALRSTIARAYREQEGDLLVFLPGAGEIRRTEEWLRQNSEFAGSSIHPLYGNLPYERQDEAIRPRTDGRRKIVLSTPIAETGLTVEGVRVVVDSGLARYPRFSPRTGMTRLETAWISQASADQRRGRAGRTAPGVCYRLWTEEAHRRLPAQSPPEIETADLAELALELALWGASPDELQWMTPPSAASYLQATDLLRQLGAITDSGAITPHGVALARLPVHPRLAHMIVRAAEMGAGQAACRLAAVLADRDPLRGEAARSADIQLRLALFDGGEASRRLSEPSMIERLRHDASSLEKAAGLVGKRDRLSSIDQPDLTGLLLSCAYPDRIAAKRGEGYVLSGGRGAHLRKDPLLAREPYLVAAELDDAGANSRIDLAAPIRLETILQHRQELLARMQTFEWDSAEKIVRARESLQLGAIVLRQAPLSDPDPSRMLDAFINGIRQEGLAALPWTKASRQLQNRVAALRALDPAWPDLSDAGLLDSLELWLAPLAAGCRRLDDLKKMQLQEALLSLLSWEQRRQLDSLAPTHIQVPSGSRIPIDYSDPHAPFFAARLQEMFGMRETPAIAGGRLPLTIHLLSPAGRPVQITRDIANFWRETYFEVRKDLRGRYPKHAWPDNPLEAEAVRKTRRG